MVIVTGAGRGIGRAHTLEFARQGAAVVVNDIGAELDGTGGSSSPAQEVVDEIVSASAARRSSTATTWPTGRARSGSSTPRSSTFGGLDVRRQQRRLRARPDVRERDRGRVGRGRARPPEGTLLRRRDGRPRTGVTRSKASGADAVDARIINTSSGAGLMGSVGQAAYSAAKAGIAGLTLVQAAELGRYGDHRERDRPVGPHADDRDGVRRDDGGAGRGVGRVRRHGARERLAAGRVAGLDRCRGT